MNDLGISLSSRALQRLLAGEVTRDEFIAAHGWSGSDGSGNPFSTAARNGRMITNVEIEVAEDKDDDWLTFSFGPPDAAAAPFYTPATTKPNVEPGKG